MEPEVTRSFEACWSGCVRCPVCITRGSGPDMPPRPPLMTMAVRLIKDKRDETRFMKVGSATPGYLRALGAGFVSGRDFDEADEGAGAAVVILSESTARFYFPGEDAVGKTISRFRTVSDSSSTDPRVIGVVRDIKYEGLDSPVPASGPSVDASSSGNGYLIVRASGHPMRLASEIRRAAQSRRGARSGTSAGE